MARWKGMETERRFRSSVRLLVVADFFVFLLLSFVLPLCFLLSLRSRVVMFTFSVHFNTGLGGHYPSPPLSRLSRQTVSPKPINICGTPSGTYGEISSSLLPSTP